jgi:drug/metabolite transporter (DMT)-like permease
VADGVTSSAPGGDHSHTGLGILFTIAAALCFASMDATSKLLVTRYSIVQILWIRYIYFVGFSLVMMRRSGVRATMRSRRPWLQAGRALVLIVENGVFVLAFKYLPLAEVHAIAASSPLIVVALAAPLLGERAGLSRWIAVGAGFAGVLVVLRPGFQAMHWPLLVPVAGAFLWALYQILVRLCGRADGPLTTLFWSAVVGCAAVSAVGPFQWRPPDAVSWLLLLVVALFGSLGQFALIKALQHAEAGAVQPYSYTLLLWAATLGYLVFGNVPDRWTIAGGAVVVSSGIYSWWQQRHADRQPA